MTRITIVSGILFTFLAGAVAEPPFEMRDIGKRQFVEGSRSPDAKYSLFDYHLLFEDTKSFIGLMTSDGRSLLCNVDSATKWMTDREVASFLTVLWNRESTLLATHDALGRHSKLCLYRVRDGKAQALEVPDLLPSACKALGIKRTGLASSGQLPQRWRDASTLEVKVRVKSGEQTMSTVLVVSVSGAGLVSVVK